MITFSPSKRALEALAKQLVQNYPDLGDSRRPGNGWEMWFFHTTHATAATGFLEERLKSQRRKLQSKSKTNNEATRDVMGDSSLNWESDNDEGMLSIYNN